MGVRPRASAKYAKLEEDVPGKECQRHREKAGYGVGSALSDALSGTSDTASASV